MRNVGSPIMAADISHHYRRLAADALEALHAAGGTNKQRQSNLHFHPGRSACP
jgi:hypothetical protein